MSPSAARRPARKADVCTSDVGLLPVPALLGSLLTGTRTAVLAVLAVLFAAPGAVALAATEPPFGGTTFISPDVITEADPTALRSVVYTGRAERVIWDYRVFDWITVEAYLFEAQIGGRAVEFQVNPEFESEAAAREQVDVYAPAIGRLPAVLLSRLGSVHVNAGRPEHPDALLPLRPRQVFGGNWFDQSNTIHTGRGEEYISGRFLEEVLFHEAAHVSVDGLVEDTPEWRAAQDADGAFISTYARDFADREDVAESILPYFAVRLRPGSLTPRDRAAIEATIPNRLAAFDAHAFDWSPYGVVVPALPVAAALMLAALLSTITRPKGSR